ncbi:MAG: TRAP transporter substrate-binding protein DctP [Acidobacteriota bacterium]
MKKAFILTCMILMILSGSLNSMIIKIGSVAPAKSPWDKALREMGREWKELSNGTIRIKIYPGGIAGTEEDMIRKMRFGTLGGAVFTNRGLTKIYSDFYILNIPFLFNSEKEFLYITEKMNPTFESGIEKKGYKVIIWSMAGWVHFFAKRPLRYPKDLKKHKLSFTVGEPELEQVWKKSGYQVIPNSMNDLMMGLQSGMVDSFYLPPLVAASGQYFPLAPNMCSMKIAPIYGGIVISDKKWKKIPEKLKVRLMESARKTSLKLHKKTTILEAEAIDTMKKNGLKINDVPEDSISQWRGASEKGVNSLIGKVFSKAIYDKMMGYLLEYRKVNEKK